MSGDWVRVGALVGAVLFAGWMAWGNTPELDGVDNANQYRLIIFFAMWSGAMTWLRWWGVLPAA